MKRLPHVVVPDRAELPEDFGGLLIEASTWLTDAGGVLLLADPTPYGVGSEPGDRSLPTDHPALTSARRAGWTAGNVYNGWAKFRARGRSTVNLCIFPWQTINNLPLLYPTVEHTAQALSCWQVMLKTPWFGGPGTAGSDALEPYLKSLRPRGATLKPSKPGAIGYEMWMLGSDWSSRPEGQYLHGYDANRMFLAGAMVAEFAPWTLKPTGKIPFDKKLGGWWLIDSPPWNDRRMPDPAGYQDEKRRWVSTPTAALLKELEEEGVSAGFDVLDSYTGTAKRILRPWGEAMDKAWKAASDLHVTPLARAIKQAAARETLGLLNSSTYTTYRPDWWATIVAQSRVNLWRKCRRIGLVSNRWPVKIETDCVWYSSEDADPVTAAPPGIVIDHGRDLGKFKIQKGE